MSFMCLDLAGAVALCFAEAAPKLHNASFLVHPQPNDQAVACHSLIFPQAKPFLDFDAPTTPDSHTGLPLSPASSLGPAADIGSYAKCWHRCDLANGMIPTA
ncbi:unnamed protein product [Clonostachys rosea]|uniref:Uncharacterized protein n=1 Tax=Bionectria ochroleuca TaxID=29856 RepID=A0ABY6TVV6_BIOOC|nr:unnamed protein product [Clonostachys rosea]